ncbi:MAG: nucleotide exchange factor GrpE [bacterium]
MTRSSNKKGKKKEAADAAGNPAPESVVQDDATVPGSPGGAAEEAAAGDPADEEALEAEVVVPSVEEEPSVEDQLRRERDDFQEKWLRVLAELDNVRKRARRDVDDARRHTQADLLRSFLTVHDNMERALQSLRNGPDSGDREGFLQGVELIHQSLAALLKERGVTPVEAMGQEFDPNLHEAVAQLPREGVESGHVIEIVQQGFRIGDLVLRPARVIISS